MNGTPPWPDEALLKSLREKEPEAISHIVRSYTRDLFRASLGLGLKEADAEELVQATFVSFLEAAQRFEGRSSVRTFLFGILYRKALEQGRRKSRELAVDPGDQIFDARFNSWGHWSRPPQGPDEEASSQELARFLEDCFQGLSDQQRAAFNLKEIEGQSNEDIGNILDLQDTHLRVVLFRARNKLRDCLEKKWK